MKVSGQNLVMQEFENLVNKSYWGYIQLEHYPLTNTFQIYVKKLVGNCLF